MENKNKLFREKSVDQIKSPEALNDYLKVTSPGVWFLLAAIIVILAGVCFWGFFGHINSTDKVAVVADNNKVECYVPEDALEAVVANREVTIDGKKYTLQPDSLRPQTIKEDTNVYVLLAGELSPGDIVYPIKISEKMDKGIYSGTIVVESLTPASFLLNLQENE